MRQSSLSRMFWKSETLVPVATLQISEAQLSLVMSGSSALQERDWPPPGCGGGLGNRLTGISQF